MNLQGKGCEGNSCCLEPARFQFRMATVATKAAKATVHSSMCFGSPWQAWQLFVRCTLQEWRQILEYEDNNEVKALNLRKLEMAVPGICAHPDFCGRVGSGQGF